MVLLSTAEIGFLDLRVVRKGFPTRRSSHFAGAEHVGPRAVCSARRVFCSTSRMVVPVAAICESPRNVLHELRRDAERPLVESSIAGLAIIARPMASICCSPPESVPPCWPMRSPRRGRASPRRRATHDGLRVLCVYRAEVEVLAHAQVRKDGAPLGTRQRPSSTPIRCREDSAAVLQNVIGPRARARAHHALQRRGLSRSVGGDEQTISPFHLERDSLDGANPAYATAKSDTTRSGSPSPR